MNYFKNLEVKNIIKHALKEDIGKKDITTELVIPKSKYVKAVLLVKENCIVSGLGLAGLVFKTYDEKIKFKPLVKDGQNIKKGKVIAKIWGRAQSIITAERVALNFISLLTGITTKTRAYVEKVKPYKVKIMDTRKTIPTFRGLEKYAVRVGGGFNHRVGLDEMVLIKDNHLRVVSRQSSVLSLKKIIENTKKKIPKTTKIEIEVQNLKEFREALKLKPDIIMLDNMSVKNIQKAVQIRNDLQLTTYNLQLQLEASGGITLKNIRRVAATGVDVISIGDLTHSVKSIDMSLEVL